MRGLFTPEPALAAALIHPPAAPLLAPLVEGALAPDQAEGLDLILEGFLLHHGRPRHLDAPAHGAGLLAGDYCYATGLVRVAGAGDLAVIRALADLIATGAALAATGRHAALVPLWRGTVAAITRRHDPQALAAHGRAVEHLRAGRTDEAQVVLTVLAADLPPTPALAAALEHPQESPA
ncbi:MAG: hypothetical protein RIB67_04595 [Miltoncostaeaceae bacterium]